MRNKLVLFISVNILTLLLSACIADSVSINRDIAKTSQDPTSYLNPATANQPAVSPATATRFATTYLDNFFGVWSKPPYSKKQTLRREITKIDNAFSKNPGYNLKQRFNDPDFGYHIKNNVAINNFPNFEARAITVNISNLRVLPTDAPSYGNAKIPGEGFPFDNLQNSLLSANTPLYVLHKTKDAKWCFVITPFNSFGWIKTSNIAIVNTAFMQKWQDADLVVAVKDNVSLYDTSGKKSGQTRISELFPLVAVDDTKYQVLIAGRDDNGKAIIKSVSVKKNAAHLWPLTITEANIAILAKEFVGRPYGWGGVLGRRDCSETTEDLFAPFGIWLPRNSLAQAKSRPFIDLEDDDSPVKQKIIEAKAKPFLTLILMPGHILLYVGHKNGEIYALHNRWGLVTYDSKTDTEGRAIIGRTVITTMDLGKHYRNVGWVFLDSVKGITLLI